MTSELSLVFLFGVSLALSVALAVSALDLHLFTMINLAFRSVS